MQDRFGGWNLKALMMCCVHIINNVREILLSVPRIKSSPCPFYYTFLSLSWSRHSSSSQLGTRALIFKIFFPIVHVDHTFLNLIAQTACVSFTQRERERELWCLFYICTFLLLFHNNQFQTRAMRMKREGELKKMQ